MNLAPEPLAAKPMAILLLALAALPALAGSRYQPNAAGDEVTDTATGLIWRRCAEGQAWSGSTCTGTAQYFSWDDALAQANSQARSSGVSWRLPNSKELVSLVNYTQTNPALDMAAFPGATSDWLWSSTPYASDATVAWTVHFDHGKVYADHRAATGAARLVRAGP